MQPHATHSESRHDAVIEVHGISKRYGDRQVLDGVDLRVAPGETHALLGSNGAGKSNAMEAGIL